MRLVMTLLVRDEEDILAANLEFHRRQGVDFFLVMDNLSVDSTATIVRDYERRGLARYLHQPNDEYRQAEWVTEMARLAHAEHGADWIIHNDADEFWWPLDGDLRETLARIDPGIALLRASRHNFVAVPPVEGEPFHQTMVYRQVASVNALGRPLPPKVAHRGAPGVSIAQGNHAVRGLGTATADGLVEILHFPMRRYEQFVNKIDKGGAAYSRNRELPREVGITWRALYERLRAGDLEAWLAGELYDAARIAHELAAGAIVEDRRLADFFGADGRERRTA